MKTARLLDRETKSRYSLVAHVQDREHSDWECISYIEIFLSDINDNPPMFPTHNLTSTISEDAPVGTIVTKVHAADNDLGKQLFIFLVFELLCYKYNTRMCQPI